jgi:undecaprenyl diphosphate synthase
MRDPSKTLIKTPFFMNQSNQNNFPQHIAIIPDGNRRWAREKGVSPWRGHYEGVKALERILNAADELDVFCFSFWGASVDNILERSKRETAVLKELFGINFGRLLKQKRIFEKEIRVNVLGEWRKYFPARIRKPIEELVETTKKHDKFFLNFFIMYDGRIEMVEAIKKIVAQKGRDKNLKITPELIKSSLYAAELPPVDLVIRTGVEGDPHNSAGFMMWDTAYSQLYFTKTLWPDFREKEFMEAIESYGKRERRMGA